ncbi:hypothetical protein pdam_00022405 [Pocillopora damicornis]|uniref:RRM domain-containing protein n=1 Tax=Pocillopora damicornis TaxID=46731 RepID=A0A3M6UGC4_POCDA|nr:hypothetical protein pdam_00022405 [Pocillopora damicornis]
MTTGTEKPSTRVIQVTNIAQNATVDQMKTLFGFLGEIEEMHLFPEDPMIHLGTATRVCFVKFTDPCSVHVAQHLTNTVFIDRALIVVPVQDGTIPDESKAVQLAAPASAVAGGFTGSSGGLLPTPPMPAQVPIVPGVVSTVIPGLATALTVPAPLPPPPPLTNVDPSKIDEIRRTVYVGNLDTTLSAEQLMAFFSGCGEIRYVRMSGDDTQPTRFAFVEFSEPSAVNTALQYNGVIFGGRPLKVNHSKNAIVKPASKSSDKDRKDIDKAMRRVKEASSIIEDEIDPGQSLAPDHDPEEDLTQGPEEEGLDLGQAHVEEEDHVPAHPQGIDTETGVVHPVLPQDTEVPVVLEAGREGKVDVQGLESDVLDHESNHVAGPKKGRELILEKKAPKEKAEAVEKPESLKEKSREKSEERSEKTRSKDKEKTRESEKERERRKEKERQREKEKQREKEREREKEKEKERQKEREREKEKERARERERERSKSHSISPSPKRSSSKAHHKKKKERKVREKKDSSSQSAEEESDKERAYPADSDQGTEREKRNRRYGSAEGKDSEGSDYDRSKKKRKKYSEEKEEDENLSDGERRGEREDSSSRRSKKKSRSYKKKPVSAGDYDSDTN